VVCENSNVRLYFSWFEKRFKLHDKIFGMIPGNIFISETCRIHFTLCPMKIVMQVLCFKSIKQVLFIHLYLLYIVVCENSSMFFVFSMEAGTCCHTSCCFIRIRFKVICTIVCDKW